MNTKRLLIVGGGSGLPGMLDRARRRGVSAWVVQKRELIDSELLQLADRVIVLDYERDPLLETIVAAIHRVEPFCKVISLTEPGLMPAARLNRLIGEPALSPEIVERTRDKFAMRQALAASGFETMKAAVGRQAKDLREFREQVGARVIVKPRDGVGSQQVFALERDGDPEQIAGKFQGEFLMEEYLEGRELSIETFSFQGEHVVFGINEETKFWENSANPYVEIAHEMPARIAASEKEALTSFITGFLDCIGISDGPAHTEVKLTPRGPRILETHNRVGGDHLPTLVRITTGFDLYELAVSWPCGLLEPPSRPPEVRCGAAIRYFTPQPGVVQSIHGVDALRGEPGVVALHLPLSRGSMVKPIRQSSDRPGYVIATAPTAHEAAAICQRIVAGICIETARPEPGV